jgi:hypothetical protein
MSTFMPLRLRPTMLSDLDFVISVEQDLEILRGMGNRQIVIDGAIEYAPPSIEEPGK